MEDDREKWKREGGMEGDVVGDEGEDRESHCLVLNLVRRAHKNLWS